MTAADRPPRPQMGQRKILLKERPHENQRDTLQPLALEPGTLPAMTSNAGNTPGVGEAGSDHGDPDSEQRSAGDNGMNRKTGWILGALMVAVLFAVSPVSSQSGRLHGRHMMGGERIDLSELADGEMRTFGEGEHQITVVREGDLITIAVGDTEMVSDFTCNALEDHCFVILSGDDHGVKLVVSKGSDGNGHVRKQIMVMAVEDGGVHGGRDFVFSDEDGELAEFVVSAHGDGPHWVSEGDDDAMVFVTMSGEGGLHTRHLLHADATTLRCPEGDTTMRLQEGDEDDGPFYCPKHDIKLEKMDLTGHLRQIHLRVEDDE